MARQIDLTRYSEVIENVPSLETYAFRLKIVASNPVDMPAEIFLFQRNLLDPYTNQYVDEFLAVCSPDDILQYPVNDPGNTDPPFFRKDTIDVIVPSRTFAEDMWSDIQNQVNTLIKAMNAKDTLQLDETVTITGI